MIKQRNIITIALMAGILATLQVAAQPVERSGIYVSDPLMVRTLDGRMSVSMELDFSGLEVGRNATAVFVPVIVKGEESRSLSPVGVYGRTRWYQAQRSGTAEVTALRQGRRAGTLSYVDAIPYEEWMNGARLELRRTDYGCCGSELSSWWSEGAEGDALANYKEFSAPFRYVRPVAEGSKVRELSACAYVDYPVNLTDIHPDYRNNRQELGRITATIDSLRADADITVSSLTIKGYASPEGDYANNERLAKGRTEALRDYVAGLYDFGAGFIATAWEAEDWTGLRSRVDQSSLPHRAELLAIIDDATLDPDAKDWRMKLNYADDYKVMLETMYPALRRSDYQIRYTVRSYDDVETIRSVMATSPQKLSLNEMYVLAQTLEPGSEEFIEVFETAVRLFPNDPVANLNAANAAMGRGDLKGASKYLSKAGESAEADYARGMLEGLAGHVAESEEWFRSASAKGLPEME